MIIYLLMVLHSFISLHSDRALKKKDNAIAAKNSQERTTQNQNTVQIRPNAGPMATRYAPPYNNRMSLFFSN